MDTCGRNHSWHQISEKTAGRLYVDINAKKHSDVKNIRITPEDNTLMIAIKNSERALYEYDARC